MKKNLKKFILNPILILFSPITLLSTIWLKFVKKSGTGNLSNEIFMTLGVFPVLDQYYQPLINPKKHLNKSLRDDRVLSGIDFNTKEQLDLLSKFRYNEEMLKFPLNKTEKTEYYFNNLAYLSGDGEYLYNIIRHFKPKRIIEIGSGFSTLMSINAIKANKKENDKYSCEHYCIEPYEQPWLDELDINLIRKKVEEIELSFFQKLEENDILFIDSTHIIRPQGDVLFEFLEILPILKSGVLVHVHDIFSPKDYLNEWIFDQHLFWNEQYLLEAFLCHNTNFRIIGALNYLSHNFKNEFQAKCPVYETQPFREPGAFWMIKN